MGEFQGRSGPLQAEECIAGMNKQAETPAGNLHQAAAPGIRMNGNRLNKPSGPGKRFSPPLAWLFLIFCATLLVGCGGKAATGHSGHGWFFILTFCALALFGFLGANDKGMTVGKFLGWLIMTFVLWKGMNWTVEGSGWLLHRMGDAKEWIAGAAKPEAKEPQAAAVPAKVVEKPRPSSRNSANPPSADTRHSFGEPVLGTRPSQSAENKSDDIFGAPRRQAEVKPPRRTTTPSQSDEEVRKLLADIGDLGTPVRPAATNPQPPPSSREPKSPLSADTRQPFGEPVLGTPPSRTAGNKSDNDFGSPNIPTEAKGPAPVEPPTFKTTGGGTMVLLQEPRDPLPSQAEELEFLEKRMGEIEVSLLMGLKKATAGKQPVEDLKHMVEDLKMVTSILKLPEECQFKKSVEAQRQKLDKKSVEIDAKIQKGQTGKNDYMEMFTEIKRMRIRADALCARFESLKSHADALAQEAAGWIDLYNDTVGFKGEVAARAGLATQLLEKEKSLTQEQGPKKSIEVPPSPKTRNKNK